MDSETRGQYLNLAGPDFWISSPVTYHVTLNFSTMDNRSIFRVRNFGYEWTDQMAVLIFWIYSLISTILCKKYWISDYGHDHVTYVSSVQKNRKNSPVSQHRTTLSGYIFASKACIDKRKKTRLAAISPLQVHAICWSFPSRNINYFPYRVAQKFLMKSNMSVFDHFLNSLCVQVFHSSLLAELQHGTPAVGVTRTLPRPLLTLVQQTAPPIFVWAAIRWGFAPLSSF